jgi:hypothetical protein
MARFVNARKAEVAVLAHFAVFSAVYNHGGISCACKLLAMFVINRETDSLPTEPIT